jgi:hypothetical protein
MQDGTITQTIAAQARAAVDPSLTTTSEAFEAALRARDPNGKLYHERVVEALQEQYPNMRDLEVYSHPLNEKGKESAWMVVTFKTDVKGAAYDSPVRTVEHDIGVFNANTNIPDGWGLSDETYVAPDAKVKWTANRDEKNKKLVIRSGKVDVVVSEDAKNVSIVADKDANLSLTASPETLKNAQVKYQENRFIDYETNGGDMVTRKGPAEVLLENNISLFLAQDMPIHVQAAATHRKRGIDYEGLGSARIDIPARGYQTTGEMLTKVGLPETINSAENQAEFTAEQLATSGKTTSGKNR